MAPSIGRIVHYHSFGTPKGEYQPRAVAAIVTQVSADGTTVGHWTWPPRV